MSKKSYLLGLGIGITVTTLILGISFQSRKTVMTDEEIIIRAKELGMIENTIISELEQNDASEVEQDDTNAGEKNATLIEQSDSNPEAPNSEESNTTATDTKDSNTTVTDSEESNTTVTDTEENSTTATNSEESNTAATNPDESSPSVEVADTTEIITITINAGESSVSVSKKLAEAGLVEDATSYDVYLCSNGYDKRISVGSHPIPVGSSLEEIAKLISSKQ